MYKQRIQEVSKQQTYKALGFWQMCTADDTKVATP